MPKGASGRTGRKLYGMLKTPTVDPRAVARLASALIQWGHTEYDSKILAALTLAGQPLTDNMISRVSGVPRTKCYFCNRRLYVNGALLAGVLSEQDFDENCSPELLRYMLRHRVVVYAANPAYYASLAAAEEARHSMAADCLAAACEAASGSLGGEYSLSGTKDTRYTASDDKMRLAYREGVLAVEGDPLPTEGLPPTVLRGMDGMAPADSVKFLGGLLRYSNEENAAHLTRLIDAVKTHVEPPKPRVPRKRRLPIS